MSDTSIERFEQAGLAALVRAGERRQWFFGHHGAAMIAGAGLLRQPDLPGAAGLALSKKLVDLCEKHRDWFAPLDIQEEPSGVEGLIDALRLRAGRLRTSGHPTIYATAGLRVLASNPGSASPRVIDALRMLQEATLMDDVHRYFGVPDYFEVVEREAAEASQVRGDSTDAFWAETNTDRCRPSSSAGV